ncbi:acylglycerol lipase [Ranunculus cassubicifolius]
MISLRQALPTSKSFFPNVKKTEKVLSLCKNLQFTTRNSKVNSPLFGSNNAFEFLLLRLPFKRFRKRKDLIFRVSGSLKSEVKLIGDKDVELRREIAIKRVLEDNDGRSVRDYFLFPTSRGDKLFIQSWTPVSNKIKGLVIILHGLNEHSGRYNDFAKQLNANGYKVYGMDWSGHGGSDGLHAYVPSLDAAVIDMKAFVEKVSADNSSLPCFCFGHSTGGAIILKVLMDPAIKALMKGAVLTSPAVRVKPSHPILWVIAPIFAFLLPKYQFKSAMKKGLPVSRDPEALIAKYSDPLVYKGAIRVRTGSEILRLSSFLQQNLSKLTVPFLVLHGTSDTVTDPTASQLLHDEASSTDKSIKLYSGYLHDLLFEPEKEMIENDIIAWLNSR